MYNSNYYRYPSSSSSSSSSSSHSSHDMVPNPPAGVQEVVEEFSNIIGGKRNSQKMDFDQVVRLLSDKYPIEMTCDRAKSIFNNDSSSQMLNNAFESASVEFNSLSRPSWECTKPSGKISRSKCADRFEPIGKDEYQLFCDEQLCGPYKKKPKKFYQQDQVSGLISGVATPFKVTPRESTLTKKVGGSIRPSGSNRSGNLSDQFVQASGKNSTEDDLFLDAMEELARALERGF